MQGLWIDRVGEKFTTKQGYEIEIIEYICHKNCIIKFNDKRGTTLSNVRFDHIKEGSVSNPYHHSVLGVGYLGIGEYTVKINGVTCLCYRVWNDMLRRCYSEKHQNNNLTYIGCTVVEEWKCFQNFAGWYYKNYNSDTMNGWELDKDILIKGNKIYSPETCAFVPAEINGIFTKTNSKRGVYPIGVSLHKEGRFQAKVLKNKKQAYIGIFDTPEEAFQAYKKAKEEYIKEVADKWKDKIDPRVYKAMYNYKVEITD